MKPTRKHSAFTLTELIFILAAISILAAILFPAFTRARQNAARTNCQSNLKSIGAAWLQYARDSDGTMMRFSQDALCELCVDPKAATPSFITTTTTVYWWGTQQAEKYDASQSLLRNYLKSDKPLSCPAFATVKGSELGLASYGYNSGTLAPARYGPAPAFAQTARPVKLSSLGEPARTIAFADAAQLNKQELLRPSTYLSSPRSNFPNFHARHEGAGNVLFCDGHVEAMPPVYRPYGFATYAGLTAAALRANYLGDIDSDGDLKTAELFNGKGQP